MFITAINLFKLSILRLNNKNGPRSIDILVLIITSNVVIITTFRENVITKYRYYNIK